ncbi:Dual oxidase [Nymphon striatum]|nr:Dual oxidase [Nymphon striatum]
MKKRTLCKNVENVEPPLTSPGGKITEEVATSYPYPCEIMWKRNGGKNMMMKQEKQRFDGWYNNQAHPEWGAIDSTLTRKTPPSYADGVYMMAGQDRPSPRLITEALMKGADGQASLLNRTAMFVFFGQVVSFEIMMASESGCPIEMQKIEIERCDHMYDKSCKGNRYMPFHRAGYKTETGQSPNNPREQVNAMTSWIDASFLYSTSEPWINCMRSFVNGTLRSEEGGALPVRNEERVPLMNQPSASNFFRTKNPQRMFLLGDPRSNQNPGLLALGILFFRYHNALAKDVQEEHPDWTDEDIFQKARRKVVASLQSIVAYEFIPALLQEDLDTYTGYKPEVHPGVSHVFQSAAFRFSHTLIPPGLYMRNNQCDYRKSASGSPALRLCSTWWGSEEFLTETSFEELLMGMSSQLSEKEDPVLCSDVRDKLFGPLDFTRRDLGALNIMRGRDNGLPDYNLARKCFNMPMISNWTQINPQLYKERPEIFSNLERIYGSTNNIDLYVGGMLETVDGPGPLFTKIIKNQFENIRDADRFWFENKQNEMFTDEEIETIRNLQLHDVIIKATSIKEEHIQKDLFFWNDGDPCQQPKQLGAKDLDECVLEHDSFDYFSGSEVAYIYSCLTLAFIPIIVASLGYGVVKLQNKRRRKLKIRRDEQKNSSDTKTYDKMYVREWLHQNHKRWVKLKFGPDESFSVVNRKGVVLRKISFKSVDTLVVQVTQDTRRKPMVLVNALRDYDLVLEFDNIPYRKKFLNKLENFLTTHHKVLETVSSFRDPMLASAETKERRQKKLEHFFREAYALTFGLKPGERRHFEDVSSDVIMVMRTSLSRKEFAEALGMKSDSLFVKQMFNCVDKDGDGRISFQEFLDTIVLFSKGALSTKTGSRHTPLIG